MDSETATRPETETPADHLGSVRRLKRIRGQIDGIIRMIEERRYCPDILTQTAAVKSAVKAVEMEVLERHLRHCVRHTFEENGDIEEQIQELDRIFKKFIT